MLPCLGCGNCADICPGNPKLGKALTMVPFKSDATDMKMMAADRGHNLGGYASYGVSSSYCLKTELLFYFHSIDFPVYTIYKQL